MLDSLLPSETASEAIDWCEHNYAVTPFIAEFFNTITAVPLAALAIHGMRKSSAARLLDRFQLCYLLMFIMSLGTAAFHATLWLPCQYMFELPRIWGVLLFLYSIMALDAKSAAKHTVLLGGHALITSCVYLTLSFQFFVATYCFSLSLLGAWSVMLLRKIPYKSRERDNCIMLLKVASVCMGTAFIGLWLPEALLCSRYPSLFQLLHLHAVYNVLDAVAQYCWVVFCTLSVYHWSTESQPVLCWTTTCWGQLHIPHVELIKLKAR